VGGQFSDAATGQDSRAVDSFHVVAPGETLSEIARNHMNDASRPEIFALNGSILTNPDIIIVGQVLQLPPK
jgi:nucleoid-associated protein YgaU